ncbi:hypothetical protein ACOBV9_22440 (plasmid) [Pseudoalteromonas espejiana]
MSWDDTDQIDKRLSQNHQLYGNISEVVEKYPQELVEKLGDLELSEKFVNIILQMVKIGKSSTLVQL